MWRQKLMYWMRNLALFLFWPGLGLIIWGELTPNPPAAIAHFWDKSLHFTAYFGLASMATLALGLRRPLLWAILGIIAFGGVLEILQGFTGRDPDILDELANSLGAVSGFLIASAFIVLMRPLVAMPWRD